MMGLKLVSIKHGLVSGVVLFTLAGPGFAGKELGVDVYPDRSVSRPPAFFRPAFESGSGMTVKSANPLELNEIYEQCSYTAIERDDGAWYEWDFKVRTGQLHRVAISFNEKSNFLRIEPEAISFEIRNLGTNSVGVFGLFQELDWTPAEQDRFYTWHTAGSGLIEPGETRRVRFSFDSLAPMDDDPGRDPRYPGTLFLRLQDLKPSTDYQLAFRGFTIHTTPSQVVVASAPAVTAESDRVHYQADIALHETEWHGAYLEIRDNPWVLWRVDVADRLRKSSDGHLICDFELPPYLAARTYELGLAVDGRRVVGSEVSADLGVTDHPGFPTVSLRPHNGRPTIHIDGEPFIWTGYASYEWQPGPMEDFGDSGVNCYLIPLNAGRHVHQINPPLMTAPGQLDFGAVDEYILQALSAAPDAKLLLRISLALPPHLLRQFPDDIAKVRTEAGDIDWEETGTLVASYTSENWKKEQSRLMRELLAYVERQPYARQVIGACITSGRSEEWFMYGVNENVLADYSPANQSAFLSWCEKEGFPYKEIPGPAERWADTEGLDVFPDNAAGKVATAYARFMSEASADALLYFCREAKEATGGRLLTGSMYAYVLQLAGEPRQHLANNLNLGDLLDSPDIDFLMGIPLWNYRHRIETGYDSFVTSLSSVNLHGKTFVNENDTFSWLHNGPWYTPYDRADPLGAVTKVHQRVCGSDVVFGNQSEWFGLFANWHYDPEGGLMKLFKQINEIKIGSVKLDREPAEEIAFLIDDTSYNWTTPGTTFTEYQLPRFVYELARTGAAVGLYLLSDIDQLPERIKLAVVPWAPAMSPETRHKLSAALRSGKRDIYLTGPVGLINTDPAVWAWDETGMREEFGLPIHVVNSTQPMTNDMQVTLSNGATTRFSPQKIGWGFSGEKVPDGHPILTCPTLAWEGEGAFARTPGRAVAGRQSVNGKSVVWSSVAIQDERFLDELVAAAGIHRYVPRGFTVQAARGVVSVMASTGGTAEVDFGRAVVATDLFTGESKSGQKQKWNFKPGGTRLFKLEAE